MSVAPVADAWMCHGCGFLWSGRNRAPPYPFCPECDVSYLPRLRVPEVPLAEAGFIPSRIHRDG